MTFFQFKPGVATGAVVRSQEGTIIMYMELGTFLSVLNLGKNKFEPFTDKKQRKADLKKDNVVLVCNG